jgi:hypothetical protein
MIKYIKPTNLNGAELLDELNAAGISITEPPFVDGNGDLYLDIVDADAKKAEAVVLAHNGTTVSPEPTINDKLASVGLSLNDLKSALGIA